MPVTFVAPLPALAHVVSAPDTARARSYAAVAFRVGHACSAGGVTASAGHKH